MDAPRPPGGAPRAPASAQRPQPEPQRKSHQLSLFGFFRRASHEEVEEQAAERMEVIAAAADGMLHGLSACTGGAHGATDRTACSMER